MSGGFEHFSANAPHTCIFDSSWLSAQTSPQPVFSVKMHFPATSRSRTSPPAVSAGWAVFGLFLLVGCNREVQTPPRNLESLFPRGYVYVPPPRRVATELPASISSWNKVLALQHKEMQETQARLAAAQEIHLANRFDDFLLADTATLAAEQLASLWHFADKGYFTLERVIMKKLLQDRLAENEPLLDPARGQNIEERASLLAKQNELKLRDLRTASEMYEGVTKHGEFNIPTPANPEQLDALRELTKAKLEATRKELATLDAEISNLQAELNGKG